MSYHRSNSGSNQNSNRGGAGLRRQRSPSPDAHPQHASYNSGSGSGSGGGGSYGLSQSYRSQPQQRRHSPPHRPPFRRRREDMPYTIPDIAPRLHVPHELPVDVTAFLDLIAFYVVQGGPTAEEEIMKREENNSHFAFLHAPWNDPMQLYYRWRLYSLLQGDTLLKWRTEPYQIERGNEAYVWVPPPAIPSGPECLLDAFQTHTSVYKGSDKNKDLNLKESPQPVPSASWLSRMSVSEGAFFVTLEKPAAAEWQRLLRMEHHVTELAAPHGMPLEERVKALTAILLDGELIAQRMVFAIEHQKAALHLLSLVLDEVVRLAYDSAKPLRPTDGHDDETPRGTCSPMNRSQSGDVDISPCGDEAFYAAARCCMCLSYLFTLNDIGKNGGAAPLTEEEIVAIAPSYEKRCSGTSATYNTTTTTGNDNNNSNSNNNSTGGGTAGLTLATGSEAPHAAASTGMSTHTLPLNLPLPASAATGTMMPSSFSSLRLLNRALEKIMPTLIEATLFVALCTVQQYGSLLVDNARETSRSSAKPPGAEELEGILPLDIDQAAYVHVQVKLSAARATTSGTNTSTSGTGTATNSSLSISAAPTKCTPASAVTHLKKEDRDAVCMIAMLLISWLKQLCSSWADADVIGNRCWSTLLTKYVYLLSQPIETT
ncbi:hypothetical protein ECC02_006123 [Trypanosoma cruzi]|uniref:SURP motif domain-containing protein n=1 Tax=Trypanosoma cruzi TaxID=5693 RepID=A0A7J6Y3Z4_TRYCR|nr:hypothetical protein ECC02_006123 [Trypanosoma cruzi]